MLDLLVFDLFGFMGHFRKIYSTTSSLSYLFPPRTTITGLVAGILGRDRDSYYDEFAPEKCRVGVGLRGGIRKLVEQILYLNTDTLDEHHLRGTYPKEARVPTALELLVPEPPERLLGYRIYFHHETPEIMQTLADRLKDHRYVYPPSLGLAGFLATPTLVDRTTAELVSPKKPVPIWTVIPQRRLSEVKPTPERRLQHEDRVPVAFAPGRRIREVEDFIFEANGRPVDVQVRGEVFKYEVKAEGSVYGVFME